MGIRRIFKYCFDKWWRPLLFFAVIAGLLIINSELNIRFLRHPLGILSNISIIVLLISFCYQLYKRNFLKGFATLFIVFITVVFSIMSSFIGGDGWADGLTIPKDIQIEVPLDRNSRPDVTSSYRRSQMDLILYNGGQPGMYNFDFWIGKIEPGTIYLKAFEITHNEVLSSKSLKDNSKVSIINSSNTFKRVSGYFKIYEGDWGKFYAARFEVWLIPASGKKERKLFQKNFKIEGWMH